MDTNVAVSVVIPTHCRSDMLARAVRSAEQQSCPPTEIIVVDDADDVRSRTWIEQHRSSSTIPVSYVSNRLGRGPSTSRNLGATVASGSVLAFLDDDDTWAVDYLAEAVRRLGRADVVLTPLTRLITDENERHLRTEVRHIVHPLTTADAMGRDPYVTGSNLVISRDSFLRIGGYDEDLWIGEDSELLARLIRADASISISAPGLAMQLVHRGPRLSLGHQHRVEGYRRLIRRTYGIASPKARRGLVFRYFDAKKDAATGWRRWRYRLYAWSLSEPRDLVRRARLRAAAARL